MTADQQKSTQSPQTEIEFRILDLSKKGIGELQQLLSIVWPEAHHLTVEYLSWMYCDNPEGSALGFNAYSGSRLVGHYAAQPLRARIITAEERGLLSFNTAVHQDFRGQNLFKKLAELTYAHAVNENFKFVVGVSNANSTLLFKRQLRFQIVGPLNVKIGVGKIQYKDFQNPTFERLWTSESLKWRTNSPDKQYRLVGGLPMAPTRKGGIWALMGRLDPNVFPSWLPKKSLINPARLFIGLDPCSDWNRSLYFDVPERVKPSPLNLIFKDLTENKRELDPNTAFFRLMDFDAY